MTNIFNISTTLFFRIVIIFMALAAAAALLPGCSPKNEAIILKYNVDSDAKTLDPQIATSTAAVTIIENCFEGLLRINNDGEIECAAAESYSVSNNGRIYTFILRDGLTWNDGTTPLTVDDFKFAFERLLSPQTSSAYAANYICIKNAEKCLSGEAPISSLGVNSYKNTITFALEYANPYFPYLLAASAAMPCNEEFFTQSRGKYGKTFNDILFNGPFTISTHKEGRYYLLRQNNSYHSSTDIFGVNIYITSESNIDRLNDEKADIARLDNGDENRLDKGFDIKSYEDTMWVIAFNTSSAAMQSQYLRLAMAYSLDLEDIENYAPGQNFRAACALLPGAVDILGENYRALAGEKLSLKCDPSAAQEYIRLAYSDYDEGFPKFTILCPDDDSFALLCGEFQREWQQNIAIFVNIERVPVDELVSRVNSGNYQLAVLPLSLSYNSPAALLGEYLTSDNICNYTGGDDYSEIYSKALVSSEPAEAAKLYRELEQQLINNAVLIPLYYQTSSYAVNSNIEGLVLQPFSEKIYFGYAKSADQNSK